MKKRWTADLVLYIPVYLIWKVQISWTQKVALAFSLCLTILMIILTVIRVTGLSDLDVIWVLFWFSMAAEVGLIISAAAAFRALFLAQSHNKKQDSHGKGMRWYMRALRLLRPTFISSSRSKNPDPNYTWFDGNNLDHVSGFSHVLRITMAGVQKLIKAFIGGPCKITTRTAESLQCTVVEDGEDFSPLSENEQPGSSVKPPCDLRSKSQRVGRHHLGASQSWAKSWHVYSCRFHKIQKLRNSEQRLYSRFDGSIGRRE